MDPIASVTSKTGQIGRLTISINIFALFGQDNHVMDTQLEGDSRFVLFAAQF